jgi:hypothetical protein
MAKKKTGKSKPKTGTKHSAVLPSAYKITKIAAHTLWSHKRLFAGITFVYALLNIVLVQGMSSSQDISFVKDALTGGSESVWASLGTFTLLIGSGGNSSSPQTAPYQLMLFLIGSLAVIWTLRQLMAGKKLRVKDAYYKGVYPLVPFTLVLFVIGLELIPALLGSYLYGTVMSGGIAILAIQKLMWVLLYLLLIWLSLYLISSSMFAVYVVTLPGMEPIKALRSAKELVRYRRWTVLRKVAFLPVVLLIVASVVMVPIIIWLTPLARWVFFALTMCMLPAAHAYMYALYRELLNE